MCAKISYEGLANKVGKGFCWKFTWPCSLPPLPSTISRYLYCGHTGGILSQYAFSMLLICSQYAFSMPQYASVQSSTAGYGAARSWTGSAHPCHHPCPHPFSRPLTALCLTVVLTLAITKTLCSCQGREQETRYSGPAVGSASTRPHFMVLPAVRGWPPLCSQRV